MVKMKRNLKGEFFYCDRYNLPLEITNNRNVDIIIPKATFYFINPKVPVKRKMLNIGKTLSILILQMRGLE